MGELKFYNSLSKKTEPFIPKGSVKIYSCGPTVYDFAHIGNLRYFVAVDVLRRYLEYKGFKVRQVMNITDVGHMMADEEEGTDKVEAAAKKYGLTPAQVAEKYTKIFFRDIGNLAIKPASKYPRASAHVAEMIKMIEALLKRGIAYKAGGNVYYDISKFPAYGHLSGNDLGNLVAGARVAVVAEKKSPYDFALWISKPGHLMVWASPWGTGYPGWHIECSAMANKYLGETLDIHTGGEDNKFPHHEAEIAQSEGASGRPLARHWFHVSHLLVGGEKMSKSLGNFYTLGDLMSRGYEARELRYLLLSVHYRDTLNFTFPSLDSGRAALGRLDEFWTRLGNPKRGKGKFGPAIAEARAGFESAMDEDLNISAALGALWGFVRKGNALLDDGVGFFEAAKARRFLKKIDGVLGLGLKEVKRVSVPKEVEELVVAREEARKKKDYKKSDELRAKIKEKGFDAEDGSSGTILKKA